MFNVNKTNESCTHDCQIINSLESYILCPRNLLTLRINEGKKKEKGI